MKTKRSLNFILSTLILLIVAHLHDVNEAQACIATPEGVVEVLSSGGETQLATNGILVLSGFLLPSFEEVTSSLTVTVNESPAQLEQIEVESRTDYIVRISQELAVGDVVLISYVNADSRQDMSQRFEVVEAVESLEVNPPQLSLFNFEQNIEAVETTNCEGGHIANRTRDRFGIVRLPAELVDSGSFVMVNGSLKGAITSDRVELESDDVVEMRVSLEAPLSFNSRLEGEGPIPPEALCATALVVTATGEVLSSVEVCDWCVSKTLGINGDLLARAESDFCLEGQVQTYDEHAEQIPVEPGRNDMISEAENSGCEQSNVTFMNSLMGLFLTLTVWLRRRTLNEQLES